MRFNPLAPVEPAAVPPDTTPKRAPKKKTPRAKSPANPSDIGLPTSDFPSHFILAQFDAVPDDTIRFILADYPVTVSDARSQFHTWFNAYHYKADFRDWRDAWLKFRGKRGDAPEEDTLRAAKLEESAPAPNRIVAISFVPVPPFQPRIVATPSPTPTNWRDRYRR